MESLVGGYHDGNVFNLVDSRTIDSRHDVNRDLQMHSSLVRRLSLEKELEGHHGCVNTIAWNSRGSLLISGSDDTQINIWSYSGRKLLHSIDSGHSANIFCTKFVPETSDEQVVSGAGDAEVRSFKLSRLNRRRADENAISPSAHFQCHTRRVKKLAVEVGNPNVVWSASEDGTLRQHDFREVSSCPPAGAAHQECRSVLLDLRSGAKRSLADPPKGILALKSCDISSTRPHLLLVGGNDAFARLYDRRMLPPSSSSQQRMKPPPCVNYFCPMHLSDLGRSSLHLTHVTFSPDGEEVLLSYSGEHVYLMNLDASALFTSTKSNVSRTAMQYTAGDVAKLMSFTPLLNGLELQPPVLSTVNRNSCGKGSISLILDKCRKLIEVAEASLREASLREGADYYYAIEACNEVLDGHDREIGPALRHRCLCIRAALLLKRKWKNDAHMAIRDCYNARRIDNSSFRPLYYMSEALSQLGKQKEALDFALAAQCLSPSNSELEKKVEDLKRQIDAAEAEKRNKADNTAARSDHRRPRVLSLNDILHRSDANSDASQDGPRSEREDSDFEEELEVDFDSPFPGDEGHDADASVLHGSLNLKIHRRGDLSRETGSTNGTCGSPSSSSSSQNDRMPYQPEAVVDMKHRYVGHCNVGTDIKQASFLGQKGEYIASGSDDGRWFIWEKRTGRLVKMLPGDEAVVNCVQCHPYDGVVATSGIDSTIKIWTPSASASTIVAGGPVGPEPDDVLKTMESNAKRLIRNRDTILPFELLERVGMQELTEGSLHPFECAQS
ncbi:WD and tetratricopeptide repeats protein 1 isoform X2 [Punica granatum]|uniref:WD and tetratricopeptide repeats protein 1 isoform X2 n=1 Tax=Punica granatum TaxID=22663 RepID=A0A6P8D7M5_PUNGR|nr:WD and tetratricopeptide repeats protein 1 isoform X2 [Punica granatum]